MGERDLIRQRRKALEDPYAYMEELDRAEDRSVALPAASSQEVSVSRKLLGNPYAHIASSGDFAALPPLRPEDAGVIWRTRAVSLHDAVGEDSAPAYTDAEIEAKVREVHTLLWHERARLWADKVPEDPIALLDPMIALRALGYDAQYQPGLGRLRGSGGAVEVAGLIDTRAKRVLVGEQFSSSVRAFTAAHELGHAVLHSNIGVLHKDKPLEGGTTADDPIETQASKFAARFLMPSKLLRARFLELFLADEFVLTEETAFALIGRSIEDLVRIAPSRRKVSRLLARAARYNGRAIAPLHSQFNVSYEAMAIRLEELSLVPLAY